MDGTDKVLTLSLAQMQKPLVMFLLMQHGQQVYGPVHRLQPSTKCIVCKYWRTNLILVSNSSWPESDSTIANCHVFYRPDARCQIHPCCVLGTNGQLDLSIFLSKKIIYFKNLKVCVFIAPKIQHYHPVQVVSRVATSAAWRLGVTLYLLSTPRLVCIWPLINH